MEIYEIIGLIAGICTTFAFVPQILKSWKTKSTRDLSWEWLFLLILGAMLWFIYGVMISSLPVILANLVMLGFVITLIYVKHRYG
ncbi:SemiSWEET transporter [Candidatus Micrarchaeota archaeon]|nr:SemiSWEET transporter [Candidatus Micrarchaeota archaeon]